MGIYTKEPLSVNDETKPLLRQHKGNETPTIITWDKPIYSADHHHWWLWTVLPTFMALCLIIQWVHIDSISLPKT